MCNDIESHDNIKRNNNNNTNEDKKHSNDCHLNSAAMIILLTIASNRKVNNSFLDISAKKKNKVIENLNNMLSSKD